MVNNFNQIQKIIIPKDQNDLFYHLQIIRRGKDHPDLPSANRTIKAYFITSASHLEKVKDEIINLCELFKARAYINIAEKSVEKLGKLTLFNLSKRIYDGDYKHIWKAFNTAAGKLKSKNPKWIIDIDDPEVDEQSFMKIINTCKPKGVDKYVCTVPTKNGYHLITKPFDLKRFKEFYPKVDVHRNNPTVLYIPKSLD